MAESDHPASPRPGAVRHDEEGPDNIHQRIEALENELQALTLTFKGDTAGPVSRVELRALHRDLSTKLTDISEHLEKEFVAIRTETERGLAHLRQDVEWLIRSRNGENLVTLE